MQTLSALLEDRLRSALGESADLEAKVTGATDARFGDYQTNVAMILAKQQRTNPRQVAQDLLSRLEVSDICEAPEIAGAGFINFRFRTDWLVTRFSEFLGDPRLGVPEPAAPKTVVVDFSAPNVAKPMHVGHIRSTFIGDALARIAAFIALNAINSRHVVAAADSSGRKSDWQKNRKTF